MTKRKEQPNTVASTCPHPYNAAMTQQNTNAPDIALDLMLVAEEFVDSGEDPDDVRAAFIAVSIRLKQLRDEADNDARQAIAKAAGIG